MSSTDLLLAIDLGTSGPKVALVSADGRVLGWEQEAVETLVLPGGGAEQDPHEWWRAIIAATRRLLQRDLAFASAVTGICCTAQWSGTVAVDAHGRHLHNAIIWLDARGQPYVNKITGGPIMAAGYGIHKIWPWVRRTGGIPTRSGKDSIAHILLLRHELPNVYDQTYKFLEPKDYLNLKLTGEFAATVDSITLHWVTDNRDIDNVDYDPQLLRLSTLEREKLPDLLRSVDIVGTLAPEAAQDLGLSPAVQVVAGTPDLHAAAIGSGAIADGAAHLSIGTSSWISCHLPYKKTDLLHNMASFPSAIPGRYFLVNEQELAGGCLSYLRDNLLFADDGLSGDGKQIEVARLEEVAAAAPPGSGGLIFTPWLNGERTPVDDSSVRGGFHNMSMQTTRAHLIRAVLEGVAFNTRWLLGYVEKFVGHELDGINMVGGGANSALWCRIFADILERPIRQVADPTAAPVRGAGILGAIGLGYTTFEKAAELVAIQKTFLPNAKHRPLYEKQYRAFLDIYKQNRRIYQRLNSA